MQNCGYYNKRKKRSAKTKIRVILFTFLLLIVLLFIYYFKVVCPVIVSLSEEKIKSIATYTISEVVGDVLIEEGITYKDLTKITYSSTETIEMIEIDTIETNKIIRLMTKQVQEKFNNLGKEGVDISLGTFTGIPFLYGIGPQISVQLVPIGTINTKINSNFTSAGINQTMHHLNFVVGATIGMILPAKTQNFYTELEVLLCENLIVGKVPEVYLQGSLI